MRLCDGVRDGLMTRDETGGGGGGWGEGADVCRVGWRGNDAANTRARWDRTPKQLRVTVITQAKLPSMVYVHVCLYESVLHACGRAACMCSIPYIKVRADVHLCAMSDGARRGKGE